MTAPLEAGEAAARMTCTVQEFVIPHVQGCRTFPVSHQ